jgi:hypothetical protein
MINIISLFFKNGLLAFYVKKRSSLGTRGGGEKKNMRNLLNLVTNKETKNLPRHRLAKNI